MEYYLKPYLFRLEIENLSQYEKVNQNNGYALSLVVLLASKIQCPVKGQIYVPHLYCHPMCTQNNKKWTVTMDASHVGAYGAFNNRVPVTASHSASWGKITNASVAKMSSTTLSVPPTLFLCPHLQVALTLASVWPSTK